MELEARVLGSLAEALLPSLPERAEECMGRDGDGLSAQLYLFSGGDHQGFMLKVGLASPLPQQSSYVSKAPSDLSLRPL